MSESVHRTVTVLFTDLEGSTDLRTSIGDDAAHKRFRAHDEILRKEILASGGTEAKGTGDGFMVLFDSARQALSGAISMQRAIEEHNRSDPPNGVKVRMGINTGEVVSEADDVYGVAVNAAARICAKAQGGQILISQVVKDLAGFVPDIRVVDRGMYWLKGFPQRWRLHEAMWRTRSDDDEERSAAPERQRPRAEIADLPRAKGAIVGRAAELAVIRREIDEVKSGGMRVLALEGEPGIGKTRLLESALQFASAPDSSFAILPVAADEELRGPFLLFRTLFATTAAEAIAEEASALETLERARDALTGRDPRTTGLSPQEQMLHVFDEVTNAIRSLAQDRPLALFIDDLQWADEDSLRLFRYLARTIAASSLFMLFTVRSVSDVAGGGPAHLFADLERMHLARRLHLSRFTKAESSELLMNLLGAPVAPQAVETLHSRAEGVPFFIEEFARTYREARVLQLVGETWTLSQATGPSVPASVASLIERRLAQLEPDTRALLANAAILGRRFRITGLAQVAASLGDSASLEEWQLEEMLEPAVTAGVIAHLPEGAVQDYTFTHDQIRATLADSISRQRRRRVHGAIVDTLVLDGAEDAANLTGLAHHALKAGDDKRGVECSIKAAKATLERSAPEESVRIVDAARAAAASPQERAELLRVKDDALAVLERVEERSANLAEMSALATAIGDPKFEMDVKLRRASVARMSEDYEQAADLASQVRQQASLQTELSLELRACLEIGQAVTHSPLGETFIAQVEVDLEAAGETFERAAQIGRELGERSLLAASLRELGVIQFGFGKHRAISMLDGGQRFFAILLDPEVRNRAEKAKEYISESLRIYEELGDKRGVMSALITLAYAHVIQPTRRGEAGRLEQVRRLRLNLSRMTTESQRAIDEAQMLFSIHTFARSHLILDLALDRGRDGYEAARAIGDRWLEFLCAGGVAMSHISILQLEEAEAWLDRAERVAMADPGPVLTRRLEAWRGLLCSAKNDAPGALAHFEKALDLAIAHGSLAGRCEVLALLALHAAKLGSETSSPDLLDRGAEAAAELLGVVPKTAQTVWEAQAWAATSLVELARGHAVAASDSARSALAALSPRFMPELYVEVLWVAARALIAGGAPEAQDLITTITENLMSIDNSTIDPEVKKAWMAVPIHKELVDFAQYVGFEAGPSLPMWPTTDLEEIEVKILEDLVSGKTDAEIAADLDRDPGDMAELLSGIYEKVGASSRTTATEYALREGVV